MDDNPYQSPQRGSADDGTCSAKQLGKRRKRILGGLMIALGGGLLIPSVVVTRQIKKGGADRANAFGIEYDRRNVSVGLTLSGAALLLTAGALTALSMEPGVRRRQELSYDIRQSFGPASPHCAPRLGRRVRNGAMGGGALRSAGGACEGRVRACQFDQKRAESAVFRVSRRRVSPSPPGVAAWRRQERLFEHDRSRAKFGLEPFGESIRPESAQGGRVVVHRFARSCKQFATGPTRRDTEPNASRAGSRQRADLEQFGSHRLELALGDLRSRRVRFPEQNPQRIRQHVPPNADFLEGRASMSRLNGPFGLGRFAGWWEMIARQQEQEKKAVPRND